MKPRFIKTNSAFIPPRFQHIDDKIIFSEECGGERMRTEHINIYQYDELPTEEAKENAREWWFNLEMLDPAWREEHSKSMLEAMRAASEADDMGKLIEASEKCEWTGYAADAYLSDHIKKNGEVPEPSTIQKIYEKAWEEELESRHEREYIEESIRINEYEFTADGERWTK
jgi:hypothetical protein